MTPRAAFHAAASAVLRPPPPLSPSAFAEAHRVLREGTTFKPGPWSNETFPYLAGIMDAAEEAMRTGKRGVVLMKSGQGGGSECWINVVLWLLTYHPGPVLYMISKDDFAREFVRDRFGPAILGCEPLRAKLLTGHGSGETLMSRRFVDGKLMVCGGRSVLNLQTMPYRVVVIDEHDSLLDELDGHGDPLSLAEIRTDAFPGDTLVIAFAHPSTPERGTGKLYYTQSDQRRGHVECPHCRSMIPLRWEDVQVQPEGQETLEQAKRDARRYVYVTPCCAKVLTDSERSVAVRSVVQRSVLSPEEAARKPWIGVHFSQLYMHNKPLQTLAEHWIDGLDDPAAARVFTNKRLGDVYRATVSEVEVADWRGVVTSERPGSPAYHRGELPAEATVVTAGVDVNSKFLHWSAWAWGNVRGADGAAHWCGWLVDWGEHARDRPDLSLTAEDMRPLDQLLVERAWRRPDGSSLRASLILADSGWQPVGVYEWARTHGGRVVCSKGGNQTEGSGAPLWRWTPLPAYQVAGVRIEQDAKLVTINTYEGKCALFALLKARFEAVVAGGVVQPNTPRLALPRDVDDLFVSQASSEYLARNKSGKSEWRRRGANHLLDCSVGAFVASRVVSPGVLRPASDVVAEQAKANEQKQEQVRQVSAPRGRGVVNAGRQTRRSY